MPKWTPEQFARELTRKTARRRKMFKDVAFEVALRGVAEGAAVATRIPIFDRGTYARRFKARRLPEGAELRNDAPHAGVIEFGRRPGRRPPPVAVILRWVRRVGLDVSGLASKRRGVRKKSKGKRARKGRVQGVRRAQAQVAFLIARAIGRRGLPAHAVFRRHINPQIRRWWRQGLREALRRKV